MKKISIPLILSFLLICNALYANDEHKKHEFYAGYGYCSVLDLSEVIFSGLVAGFSGGDSLLNKSYGPIVAGYSYYPKKWISIGPYVNYDSFLVRSRYSDHSTFTQQFFNITLMFRFDFHYANFKYVQLYSGLSLGGTAVILQLKSRGSGWSYIDRYSARDLSVGGLPAFQVNLFGIRIGTVVGLYIEFGYGYSGIVNAGISGKF